jgi:hypothetical protein
VGSQVNLIIADGLSITPVEIKSGQTITNEYFKGIQYWNKISKTEGGYVIYGGNTEQKRGGGITVLPYNQIILL